MTPEVSPARLPQELSKASKGDSRSMALKISPSPTKHNLQLMDFLHVGLMSEFVSKTEPENNLTWTRNGQDKAWKACTTTNIDDLQWTTSCGCTVVGSICFFNHWNQWKWISNVPVHHCTPLCHCSQIHPLTKTCTTTESSQNIPHQEKFRFHNQSFFQQFPHQSYQFHHWTFLPILVFLEKICSFILDSNPEYLTGFAEWENGVLLQSDFRFMQDEKHFALNPKS